ncbi:MAG: 16S rRNA (adenine(1518)-N(6)/adenine(1519)-N(6))-dimethyltransferase RsmA [Verrucomicrobiae bacterium]|nr:16S rRNA (adenine(1518)-N(6)/adenine(1519)-N(6))-dimethyltransferase RsmA [Verrucomicrobiae bacterium]
MKLSEMRELLEQRDIQLTKSLGQNFLHDSHQLERIAATAELAATDRVLEVGPGLGPLTELLMARADQVLAIEKDARLVEILRERFAAADPAKFELLQADALEFLKSEPRDWHDWKLVANLPYSVASPIIVELAAGVRAPRLIVATLQFEVARRLMAQTDDDDYGVLTLLVQLDFEPRDLFKIPPGCFFPSPDVDSACVRLVRREQPLLPEPLRPLFKRLVKQSFSQRRKMMLKLLKPDWPKEKLEAAFAQLNISLQERAEKLSLAQFVALTKILAEKN